MFCELANAVGSFVLLADSPSTFTLAAMGGGCLLVYKVLRRKPAPVVSHGGLSLESTEAPASALAPMPVTLVLQNARVPESTVEVVAADEWRNASAA